VLTSLVRLEILKIVRDSRLVAVMATFSGVLLLAGTVSWLDVREDAATKARVAAEERQRWLGQGVKDPHAAAHYSIYAFRPARALQAMDPGIVPFVGEAVWLEAHLQNDLLFRPQQDGNAFERLGLVDPAGLLMRFGPLAVFLLAFAVAAREREQGVLGLALASARNRAAYVGAKLLSVIAVGVPILVVPVVLVAVLSLMTVRGSSDEAVRLVGWALGAIAYIGVLAAIGVAICVASRSVQAAFAGLLLSWVILVLAALPAASAVASWRSPVPSFQQMKLVLTSEAPAYWTPETGAEQIASILQRYGVSREEDLQQTINIRGAQLDVAERHAQAVFDREIGRFYDRVQAQDAVYARLGWLSPAVAFDAISAAFAGTDFFHHRHFIDAAEQYRRGLVNRMNADLIPNPASNGREHTNDETLWSDVPAFAYEPRPAASAARSALPGLLALACWLLAGASLARVTAYRVQP
jgi:ABC-2 type transport system permease protein